MKRKITRALLASAIEYAAQSKITPSEWERFFLHKDTGSHSYGDALMDRARSEAVRILHGAKPLSLDAQRALNEIAARLRAGVP